MNQSISILLGAGFSAPLGYPLGDKLNNLLLGCTGDEFAFHTRGNLIILPEGTKRDARQRTSYDNEFDFCKELIKYFYSVKNHFDYEEFFDFIKDDAKNDIEVQKIGEQFISKYVKVNQLIYSLDHIYNQLVLFYLKDRNNKVYYEVEPYMSSSHELAYMTVLKHLQQLSKDFEINIHTLNHDLVFESFKYSNYINDELCDGFEELGSPYYGNLHVNQAEYRTRLERYTGNYRKKFKLYKLHGSIDYGVYYSTDVGYTSPDNYVKIRYGVDVGELLKEKRSGNRPLEYEKCWNNYHADFLTGTTSKIERYKEPLLYKKLFRLFRKNLKNADKLIIIGYGCRDSEINKMLLRNFDYTNKPSVIIDNAAGLCVHDLAHRLNSKLIQKRVEDLVDSDFQV